MKLNHRISNFCLLACLLFFISGCSLTPRTNTPVEPWAKKDLKSFPYHPLVYHLDLSILAYQLYGQSLVWPFDPYYEELLDDREAYMLKVKAWAKEMGAEQVSKQAANQLNYNSNKNLGLDTYRGPGTLGGFANNPLHDPILYNYGLIHPWSSSINNADGRWTEYLTPKEITGQIKDVFVSYRKAGNSQETVSLKRIVAKRNDSEVNAQDVLLAFEGGTGDKGEVGQPASQSLMGFVLLRTKPDGRYDVHIVFRGSRSGKVSRTVLQALSGSNATGNPDWITDLGYDRVDVHSGAGDITTTSKVSRGFARSMKSILPNVFNGLEKVNELKRGASPDNIYVTGHSLGGGLAQHFVSAVLLGNQYRHVSKAKGNVDGNVMPMSVRAWPWKQIKLITYSAPRAGDRQWAKSLTISLDSQFFSSLLYPIDRKALAVTDPDIVSRLLDQNRPAGYRVLSSSDPITSEKVPGGGKHVGKTIYVNEPSIIDSFIPNPDAHEPKKIREKMFDSIADPRTPSLSWRYREMAEMVPDQKARDRGSVVELKKLAAAVKNYYIDNEMWFDAEAFDKDLALRLNIDK